MFGGKGKLTWPFSAKHRWISAFCSPACWLYPLKPGGKQKFADVWRKTVTLIYPDLMFGKISHHHLNLFQFLFSLDSWRGEWMKWRWTLYLNTQNSSYIILSYDLFMSCWFSKCRVLWHQFMLQLIIWVSHNLRLERLCDFYSNVSVTKVPNLFGRIWGRFVEFQEQTQ